jgi:hypothetical protein
MGQILAGQGHRTVHSTCGAGRVPWAALTILGVNQGNPNHSEAFCTADSCIHLPVFLLRHAKQDEAGAGR